MNSPGCPVALCFVRALPVLFIGLGWAISSPALAAGDAFLSAIYAVTNAESRVAQFDRFGNLIRDYPVPFLAASIDVDQEGNVYVISHVFLGPSTGNFIRKYSPTGASLGVLAQSGIEPFWLGLNVTADGTIFFGVNGLTDTVARLPSSGGTPETFATISSVAPGAPFSVEFDSQDRLYSLDDDAIERFSVSGASLGVFATTPASPSHGFITDLAIDGDDNVYATTFNNRLVKYGPDGAPIYSVPLATGVRHVDVDRSDVLYVAGVDVGNGVSKFIQRIDSADGSFLGNFATVPGEIFGIAIYDPVPEPGSILLAGLGVVASGVFVAKRRRDP
ncbi:MAG: PEP-CTERM sorting domain-containing protein [Pirellulales bacterium]|nr:PEP-CTERM sorting domain-containing protein [Pirellulales bacterium]